MLLPTEYRYDDASYHTPEYLARPVLERLPVGGRVLEIGCGNGNFAKRMASLGHDVVGVEASTSAVDVASRNASGVVFRGASVYEPPQFEGLGKFDAIVAIEVIEHLQYPRALFARAKELLNPDGVLLITTPYHGYLKNLVLALTNRWDSHHNVLWDEGHVRLFSPAQMKRMADEEGFSQVMWRGLGRAPGLWKSFLFEARPR